MSEQFKYNRIKFNNKGSQKNFILKTKKILNLSEQELAAGLNISRRTLADWTKEKITISQKAALEISKLANISIPRNHKIIDWKLHLQKAGRIGSKIKFEKYGNVGGKEKYRKEKWKEWWEKIGKYRKNPKNFKSILKIKTPKKNELLAEFVGIMLGDGGISQYHTSVTLSSNEKQYISYVSETIRKLFGVKPKIYKLKYAQAIDVIVNRKKLVELCIQLGLVMGSKVKQQVDIPRWIKENKNFSKACLRGLVDTDGCFYTNTYLANGKKYSYFKIAFTNGSRPLVLSVAEILMNLGIKARISKNHKDVRIESSHFVNKYINEIGSHNHKHLRKIQNVKIAEIC